jgi:phosphohistidine phosphatase
VAIIVDIVRHGEALPRDGAGDSQRRLSAAGARCLSELAAKLAGEGWKPDHVFSSGLLRARQSAEIVARAANPPLPVETLDALEPDAEPAELLNALAAQGATAGHVLIVGHQPLLGRLVGHLTGAETGLAPGMLVRVECPNGLDRASGKVVLTIPPQAATGT